MRMLPLKLGHRFAVALGGRGGVQKGAHDRDRAFMLSETDRRPCFGGQ